MRIFFIVILVQLFFFAQTGNAQVRPWQNHTVFLGLGPSGFLGDLGGARHIGTHGIRDFDYQAMSPIIQAGYRYFILNDFFFSGRLSFGHLSGNDRHTKEPFRNNRNISFRSQLLEISAVGEWFFFSYGRAGARFSNHFSNMGHKGFVLRGYILGGVGGFYFNPQGYFNREHYLTLQHATITNPDLLPENGWYNLRRIGTEGQGLPAFPDKQPYSPLNISFPLGFGVVFSINRHFNIGIEYKLMTTLTDYIDDVSRSYINPSLFSASFPGDHERIALGEYFSNPTNYNLGSDSTMPGEQRGDPQNKDSYMIMTFSLQFNFLQQLGSPWWVPMLGR